jgi:hypothetical protein
LNGIEKEAPFFVKRMRNLALGNWLCFCCMTVLTGRSM